MTDWSPAEDCRPAMPNVKPQPERTGRGLVWTMLVFFDWPSRGYTQMTVRDVNEQFIFDHGRIYPIPSEPKEDL
jgi:hypothetical protein